MEALVVLGFSISVFCLAFASEEWMENKDKLNKE